MDGIEEIIGKLSQIRNKGYIKTHRAHDIGIGKTLEDLLGISENNLLIPDVGDIELKAKRIDSGSMLTLATKSPLPAGVNKILFNAYKYLDAFGSYCLHSTVYGSRYNNQGLKITLSGENLVLENPQNILAYWSTAIFDDILKAKSNKILLVFAETKGTRKTISE